MLECLRLSSPTRIAMIELNPENNPYLKSIPSDGKDLFVHYADFLSVTPATAPIGLRGRFDRVLMNPPFNQGQDLKHIAHAVTHWLKPGAYLTFAPVARAQDSPPGIQFGRRQPTRL